MRLPGFWVPHTVTVAPYEGRSASGDLYGDPVQVGDVYVKDVQETVTDAAGAEVVSRASVRCNLYDTPALGSKVTVWGGTDMEYTARVVKASRLSHPGWPALGIVWLL